MGAGADPLGVAQHDRGVLAQGVEDALHAVDEDRGQGLHALHGDALGELAEQVDGSGQLVHQRPRPLADRVGQQDLSAGRGPQPVLGDLEAALVGDLEPPDLLDGVAPELHAHRVVLGGREDVEDATAHGELAAALHEVGAGVGRGREVLDDLLQRGVVPGPEGDRRQLAETLDHGLQDRAHRRDDHVERPVCRVAGIGVAQPPQHGEPLADGVTARAEALVRQRLPRGEVRDGVGIEEAPQGGGEVLGLPGGGRDGEQGPAPTRRAAIADEGGEKGRAPTGGDRDVGRGLATACHGDGSGDPGVAGDDVQQGAEAHGCAGSWVGRQHESPTAARSRVVPQG